MLVSVSSGDTTAEHLGRLFWDWGIPTAVSLAECSGCGVPIIATGGVRTGIDIAKSLALGASLAGTALPLVAPAMDGVDAVIDRLSRMIAELKIAMFLCGCADLADLKTIPVVTSGRIREMLRSRGFAERSVRSVLDQ
jgi:isopentenyl-diphosphate delta-isomerase